MGLRTKSEEIQLDVVARAKIQEPRHDDEFMNVLHNRRSAWEKGEGLTLENMWRGSKRALDLAPLNL